MSIESDIACFERVPSLRVLGRDALRVLAIGAESRYLDDGEVLFRAGDASDGGYVVQQGAIVLKPGVAADGREIVAGPGMLLGELALFAETARPATAIAREPSAVIRISRSMFLKMLENYPDVAIKLRDQLAARVAQDAKELKDVRAGLDTGGAAG